MSAGPTLRWMMPADVEAVVAAADLFDHAPTTASAEAFLGMPGHHLCIAYEDGAPAGFVSGVEMRHPDKGTEMFLYELGVDDAFQGRGIGKALVVALADRARDLGCYGMWVLTDADNAAANATYKAAGSSDGDPQVMLEWVFRPDEPR